MIGGGAVRPRGGGHVPRGHRWNGPVRGQCPGPRRRAIL